MAEQGFRPGPVLLMGAPGVGKGTQAKELMARWGVPQISTGDLLRANVANRTGLGLQAKALMDAGQLVPDDVVNRMVEQRLKESDTKQGYLLDGYPRTVAQAEWFDTFVLFGHLQVHHRSDPAFGPGAEVVSTSLPFDTVIAISLRVRYDYLLRRITGRRICAVCGSIYNTYLQPPARDGFCDLEGAPLQRRDDDSEAVFEGRMRAYDTLTAPVVKHYRELGRLIEIDGELAPEAVTGQIEAAVRKLR